MKNILAVLSLAIIVLGAFIYMLQDGLKDEKKPDHTSEPALSGTHAGDVVPQTEQEKESPLQKMQEKYVVLKEARRELKLTLSRLGSRLRKTEFSPDKATEISRLMSRANYSLKNPRLLGAFSSEEEIDQELEKVQSLQNKLHEIRKLLDNNE